MTLVQVPVQDDLSLTLLMLLSNLNDDWLLEKVELFELLTTFRHKLAVLLRGNRSESCYRNG